MHIIGNELARSFLKRIALQGTISPSYLFVGPRGVGKNLTAQWWAQAIFCKSSGERPCGICSACRRMESGNYPDIFRLERELGKNIISVEQVRELNRIVQMSPYESSYRVCIVSEAEFLNIQAQNALLKTLEEPPRHSILILITSSLGKMLPTVVSRCNIVNFNAVPRQELVETLEKMGCDSERAHILAAISCGAPGSAMVMIGDEEVWDFRTKVLDLLEQLVGSDIWGAIQVAHKLYDIVPRKSRSKSKLKKAKVEEDETDVREGDVSEEKIARNSTFSPDYHGMLSIISSYYRDCMMLATGVPVDNLINLDRLKKYYIENCPEKSPLIHLAEVKGAWGAIKALEHIQEAEMHLARNVQSRLWLQNLCLNLL